jgi:hypothetical protein
MSRITFSTVTVSGGAPDGDEPLQPELADVLRLGRRLVDKTVRTARGGDDPLRRRLHRHLGPQAGRMPIISGSWLPHDQVNVQIGLDEWLRGNGRHHQLIGITRFRHRDFALADLVQSGSEGSGLGVGNVATVQLPAGPGGRTRSCVKCGLYLISEGQAQHAMLLRTPDDRGPMEEVTLEVVTADTGRAEQIVAEVRQLAVEHNVYRGQVISFSGHMFGHGRGNALSFLDRPGTGRDDVVLPGDVLAGIERQVLGVQQHITRLRASGQHLKRGVLLHGAPGTGKTHTIGYLIGQMPQATVVVVAGVALELIGQACSVARLLQPSVIVVEDVDLIAEQRGMHHGAHPLLFQLLNEMDGLGEDIDVTFLLTTNRAEILEAALAERPGRVDHAAELPLPDAAARRKLITLYQGNLALELSDLASVIERTEGVTASFLKELLRKAALFAAEDGAEADQDGPLRVTDTHMTQALDQLLDTRNQLTRVVLGAQRESRSGGVDAVAGEATAIVRPARYPG